MNHKKLVTQGLLNSLGVLAYISLVITVMNNAEKWFSSSQTYLGPMAMLLLFVISATVVGMLVLLQPILMYLNNAKREALFQLLYTIGWMVVIFIILILSLLK